jgi:8-oxo-dGTP pyrophosphatase MutT (NUDIX family)
MTTIRESVRALVIDDAGRILLSRVTPLGTVTGRDLWVTLGGRLKEGESLPQALKRELAEELAETKHEIGPEVWFGDEIVNWGGKQVRLVEHFYLVRVQPADYTFIGHDEEEVSSTHELRWWSADEIGTADATFVPCDMASLLAELLRGLPNPQHKHVQLETGD